MLERLRFDADLDERLLELLTRREVTATHRRIDRLLRTGVFPSAERRLARDSLAAVLTG